MTRRYTPLMLVVALAISSCAKSDWIEQTLVTVDVTGTWVGRGGTLTLKLDQQAAKVTGFMRWAGSPCSGTVPGAVEGTVTGDMFRFKQTSGRICLQASEMTVNGDEMTGHLGVPISVVSTLQRVDTARPTSQSE